MLVAKRTSGGHRYYDETDVLKARKLSRKNGVRKAAIYCRVNTMYQVDEMDWQVADIKKFCSAEGIEVDEIIRDVGGGLTLNRPVFVTLMRRIEACEFSRVIIPNKSTFVRYGHDFFETFARDHGCEVVVAGVGKVSAQDQTVNEMIVDDMLGLL